MYTPDEDRREGIPRTTPAGRTERSDTLSLIARHAPLGSPRRRRRSPEMKRRPYVQCQPASTHEQTWTPHAKVLGKSALCPQAPPPPAVIVDAALLVDAACPAPLSVELQDSGEL